MASDPTALLNYEIAKRFIEPVGNLVSDIGGMVGSGGGLLGNVLGGGLGVIGGLLGNASLLPVITAN